MSCQVLTQSRLEALLSGRLEAAARADLARHFEAPCDECLERLEGVEAQLLLLALAPAAALSAEEQQQTFERAVAARPVPRPVVELRRARPGLRWLALAVGAAAAAGAIGIVLPRQQAAYDGIKGAGGPLRLELRAFAAPPGGQARPLGSNVHSGEAVFFRVALEQPAHFYLYAVAGDSMQVLWKPEPNEAAWPPGERELSEGGKALGFDPARLGRHVTVVGIAAPDRVTGFQKLDAASVARLCPRCALQRLELDVE